MVAKKEKIALITGGAVRVGAEISRILFARGFTTVIHYNDSKNLACRLKNEIEHKGGKVFTIQADLTNTAALRKMCQSLSRKIPKLDLLVLNSALYLKGGIKELGEADFDKLFSLNVRAPYLCVKHLLPLLEASEAPQVIAMADVAGMLAWRNHTLYSATKSALLSMVRSLALELAPHTRVNAIAPYMLMPVAAMKNSELAALRDKTPLKKFSSIKDLSAALDFLINGETVTGETIFIDGGRHLM